MVFPSPPIRTPKILFLRSSVRNNSLSRRLASKMEKTVCNTENPVSDETIGQMIEEEGARATVRAKVRGMAYSCGLIATVETESGVKTILDARRLSLIGNVVQGSIYINESDPYTPVAFKQGQQTVGIIMPVRYEE